MALYVDQYFGLRANPTAGNKMSPEERAKWFEHNVYYSLKTTDKYVWCYSEKMNWWTGVDVPTGSDEAVRAAREKVQKGAELGFDLAPIIAAAVSKP
jgi:hypothetical protein